MPITQVAGNKAFTYVDNLGKIGVSEISFWHPVGLARGQEDVLYVLNWGYANRPSARITKTHLTSQEWICDIGTAGSGPGEFLWPGGLAIDEQENLYVTDQAISKVVSFTKDGEFISKWGCEGVGKGEFRMPTGIVLDDDGSFLIVDSRNNRIQRYTKDGCILDQFGKEGNSNGEFKLPWGIGLDTDRNIYVSDWGNSRVQKFDNQGNFLATIGCPGTGEGELDHPSDVTIDNDGDVYVADWGNERVVVFESDGSYLATLIGNATNLSRWAKAAVDSNPEVQKARNRVDLSPEWRFRRPSSINIGDDYKILIAEAQHMRVQVYQKDRNYQEAQFTL